MESKKTKLTISGTAKKSIKNIDIVKTQAKNTVVIEKPKNNFAKKVVHLDLQAQEQDKSQPHHLVVGHH